MTDRHLAALSLLTHGAATGGEPCGSYYEQHLTNAAETTTSRQSAAYHYQAQQQQQQHALQQRLLYQQQQRYHAAAYQQHAHGMAGYSHPYGAHYNHLPVRDAMSINNYLSNQQPIHTGHYDGTYHGRLMGGAAADMLAHSRARFSPYHQQKHHPFHGSSMYSAAGHQLLPSSVLHYPPRTSAYHALQQQKREQEKYNQGVYEQQMQQQQRAYLHNLHGTDSCSTSGAYNPYSISQHHYQQSQLSLLSTQQQQQHQQQVHLSRCSTPVANITNLPNHVPQGMHHTTELPTKTNLDQESSPAAAAAAVVGANYEDIHAYSGINHNNNNNSEILYQQQQQQQQRHQLNQQHLQQQFRDCLTTSPPLISGSGTDSGISSSSGCSTRGGTRGSDSTQSTPVYSGEYPMSVGSSSGVSYHYVDSVREQEAECKDIKEEAPLMMTGSKDELEKTRDVKHEANENKSDFHCIIKKEPLDEGCFDLKMEEYNQNSTLAAELSSLRDQYKSYTGTTKAESAVINRQRMDCPATPLSSTTSASGIQTTSSLNIRDRCTTPFIQTPASYAFQQQQLGKHQPQQHQQQQQQQQQYPKEQQRDCLQQTYSATAHQTYKNNNIKSSRSWSPFPSSPNNWLNRYSPICDFTNRDQDSPLQVPVPPHNSPVDFEPSATLPPLPFLTATTANNRNRIKDPESKTVKKLRRKAVEIKVEPEENGEVSRQHLTPLPGFQQTFGSTEIGRFSETFSLTPDCAFEQYANYDENSPSFDCITTGQNSDQYGPKTTQAWKCENEYYSGHVDNGNSLQYNMRYAGGVGLGYEADPYGVRSAMKLSRCNGGFNEIRCNAN